MTIVEPDAQNTVGVLAHLSNNHGPLDRERRDSPALTSSEEKEKHIIMTPYVTPSDVYTHLVLLIVTNRLARF